MTSKREHQTREKSMKLFALARFNEIHSSALIYNLIKRIEIKAIKERIVFSQKHDTFGQAPSFLFSTQCPPVGFLSEKSWTRR